MTTGCVRRQSQSSVIATEAAIDISSAFLCRQTAGSGIEGVCLLLQGWHVALRDAGESSFHTGSADLPARCDGAGPV